MNSLQLDFFSPRPLNTPEEGRALLRLWLEVLPQLGPERFGSWEPVRKPFELEAAVRSWGDPFLARRRKPRMDASVWMRAGPRRQHALFKLSTSTGVLGKLVRVSDLIDFVTRMSVELRAEFAFAHLLTQPDVETGFASDTVTSGPGRADYFYSFFTHTLERYLPELYWITVLGPAYGRHFGPERLLSAPAYRVEALPHGAVLLQLSTSPLDFRDRFAEVDAVRRRVKEHLDENSFFDPRFHPSLEERYRPHRTIEEGDAMWERWFSTHTYATPTFEFEGVFPEPKRS